MLSSVFTKLEFLTIYTKIVIGINLVYYIPICGDGLLRVT